MLKALLSILLINTNLNKKVAENKNKKKAKQLQVYKTIKIK